MRVLVVTAVWHRYAASLASILALETAQVGPLQAPLDLLFLAHDDPYADGTMMGGYRNLTRKLNHAREVFLKGDYALMLLVEDDMIVPPDALVRLHQADADVAYGLCCFRHGKPGWSPRTRLTATAVETLSDRPDAARAAWGQIIDVAGVGTFCTLVRRRVLEQVAFRLEPEAAVCCDWWLARDCQRLGLTQRAHLGVVCGHITPSPSPRVIWPDRDQARLWRMELL